MNNAHAAGNEVTGSDQDCSTYASHLKFNTGPK